MSRNDWWGSSRNNNSWDDYNDWNESEWSGEWRNNSRQKGQTGQGQSWPYNNSSNGNQFFVPQSKGRTFSHYGPLTKASQENHDTSDSTRSRSVTPENKVSSSSIVPSKQFKEDLVHFTWDVVRAKLERWPLNPRFPSGYDENMDCPLFVTWSKHDILRGCIGCLEPLKLRSGLTDYAVRSALHDTRFSPISLQELQDPELTCQVSLLHDFESASNIYDWEFGKHGIVLNFQDQNGLRSYSGTYLPEVPPEAGFRDQQTTIRELARKAGYHGRIDSQQDLQKASLTRYQSTRVKISGSDYWAKQCQ